MDEIFIDNMDNSVGLLHVQIDIGPAVRILMKINERNIVHQASYNLLNCQ